MEHLIQEHNCQKILFVAGPAQNTDANERKNTYLEMMAKYHLPVKPKMIAQGDYSEFVDKQIEMTTQTPRLLSSPTMKWHFPDIVFVKNVVSK